MTNEREPERHAEGDAVLDIGGDIGALILTTGPEFAGREVEISRLDKPDVRVHTAIHERRMDGHLVYAGIFPELEAGAYRLLTERDDRPTRVRIVGGEVTEVDWRSSPPSMGAGETAADEESR